MVHNRRLLLPFRLPWTIFLSLPLLARCQWPQPQSQSVYGSQSVFDNVNNLNFQQRSGAYSGINPALNVGYQGQQQSFPNNPFQQYLTQNQNYQYNQYGSTGFHFNDWEQIEEFEKYIDRRAPEGWWHLYPYGHLYHDGQILEKPHQDMQIDLDFDYPFYGFRFNYTYIFPNGYCAFSVPEYIQPPYTFPNPKWPERRDGSFIAPFLADQQFQFVADRGISHVYFRTVFRPAEYGSSDSGWDVNPNNPGQSWRRAMSEEEIREKNRNAWGRVIDPWLLDNITRDIQEGIIGANGFSADFAFIVTWERMGYGGAPKITAVDRYEEAKRWQNTYQMILATDEIRSYVIFNYAHINWTASTSAGALAGRGGKQSAMAGFNGGNGTGWTALPYSGEGRMYRLAQYSNVMMPGRWIYRVDEQIITGGCSNESVGWMYTAPIAATMMGGITVNVSGPCLRPADVVKVVFDEYQVDCIKLNMIRAQCVLPVDRMYKTGLVNTKMSRDSGESYPYIGTFYILQPERAAPQIKLIDNPRLQMNNWRSPNATELVMTWAPLNLTGEWGVSVDVTMWGYWENTDNHIFKQVGVLARGIPNSGYYSFNPRLLNRHDMAYDAWREFHFGMVQVSLTHRENHGVFWSELTPFSWYFLETWQYQYGQNWALDKCIEWFDYDGQRDNFVMDLEPFVPCPCTMDQAMLDLGRYTMMFGCDRDGDASCIIYKGAQHCVLAVAASWGGAGQVCCYDFEGWLMHSDDYENAAYLRFYSPGVPQRGHPFGSYPFKRPPYVPSMSNWATDQMAYEFCCRWAGNCEFYYWRRQTSGCQEYRPPATAFVYGMGHYVTYDGTRYTFPGKGYYVLSMMKSPFHNLMIQIRAEQPPKTIWNTFPNATVITGVAIQENDSDIVQILARKEFRRWRYRTDVLVNGIERFFDTPEFKIQQFRGVTLRSPERNMNQSEIHVMLDSGAGIRVTEAFGMLNVMVILPNHYNESYIQWRLFDHRWGEGMGYAMQPHTFAGLNHRDRGRFVSLGLLGTFNSDMRDDLMTPDGTVTVVSYPPTEADNRNVYYQFGEYWRVDGARFKLIFQDRIQPINNPILFASRHYSPVFDPRWAFPLNASLVFSLEEVAVTCQGVYECQYDYIMQGMREIGLATLDALYKMEGLKDKGTKIWLSCGALVKSEGAVKHPPGNNYLDGVTVTFTCKPEYFLHGTQQRHCHNGTWSEGWWVWCRLRTEEYALKWLTGICTSLLIIGVFTALFMCCYARRRELNKGAVYRTQEPLRTRAAPPPVQAQGFRRKEEPIVTMKLAPIATISEAAYNGNKQPGMISDIPKLESEPRSGTGAVHLHSRKPFYASKASQTGSVT